MSPDPAVGAHDWQYPALLWLCMWRNFTFLHIPKTGGTSIEAVDAKAPIWLQRRASSTMRNGFYRVDFSGGKLPSWCSRRRRCRRDGLQLSVQRCRGGFLHHMTPEQLKLCGSAYFYEGDHGPVYCVMREPVARFKSAFFFAIEDSQHWPRRQCGRAPIRDATVATLVASFHCYVSAARLVLAAYERQLAAAVSYQQGSLGTGRAAERAPPAQTVLLSSFLQHVLPQSAYLTDRAGKVTCDLVFSFEDLAAATLENENAKNVTFADEASAAIGALLASNVSLREAVHSNYHEDLIAWQRVRRHQAPTPAHTSLQERLRAIASAGIGWLRRDTAPQCSDARGLQETRTTLKKRCAACTCRHWDEYGLRCPFKANEPWNCTKCVLSRPECGGVGAPIRTFVDSSV